MKTMIATIKSKSRLDLLAYGAVVLIWAVTSTVSLLASNTRATDLYHITRGDLAIIQIILSLPALAIWLGMLYGALSFHRYSKNIEQSKDGPGFRYITYGMVALLASSIAGSVIGAFQTVMVESATNATETVKMFTIIRNYVSITGSLLTYGFLFWGGKSLLSVIGKPFSNIRQLMPVILSVVPLAAIYLVLVFANPAREMALNPNMAPTFGLPDWLILLTVALPMMVAWTLGFLAITALFRFRKQTSGVIYKMLFKELLTGVTMIITLTISLQILTQFSSFLANSGLGFILGLVAVIYVVLLFAILTMARGARQLNKIETIE